MSTTSEINAVLGELGARRQILELRLNEMIAKALGEFTNETGVSVDAIDVRFETVNRMGLKPQRMLTGVDVDLERI